jgi:hypothetical protein
MPTNVPEKEPKWGRPTVPKDPKDPSDGFWVAAICIGSYLALCACDTSVFADEYIEHFLRGYLLTFMAAAACIIWQDTE